MRLYALDALTDAHDYLAPHALNAEAAQAVTRSNRLDRWAFAARLPHSKIAADAFGRVRHTPISTTQTYQLNTDSAGSVVLIPMLDAAGDAWIASFDVRGGYLEVSAHLDLEVPDPTIVWRPIVMVNGVRLAPAPTCLAEHNGRDVARAYAHGPVSSGACLVELYVELYVGTPSTATVTFRDRQLLIVEACR